MALWCNLPSQYWRTLVLVDNYSYKVNENVILLGAISSLLNILWLNIYIFIRNTYINVTLKTQHVKVKKAPKDPLIPANNESSSVLINKTNTIYLIMNK